MLLIDFYESTNAALVLLPLELKTRELQQEGGRGRGGGGGAEEEGGGGAEE